MILVDTCVLSEGSRATGKPEVLAWLAAHDHELMLSAVTIGELRFGCRLMAPGKRATDVGAWLERLQATFADRVLGIDAAVMRLWGDARALRQGLGRPLAMADGLIAATALHHDLSLATRNTEDFSELGLRLIDPWQGP